VIFKLLRRMLLGCLRQDAAEPIWACGRFQVTTGPESCIMRISIAVLTVLLVATELKERTVGWTWKHRKQRWCGLRCFVLLLRIGSIRLRHSVQRSDIVTGFWWFLPVTPEKGSRVGVPYSKTECLLRYPSWFVIQHHPEFDAL
jgi:hypothetical protein